MSLDLRLFSLCVHLVQWESYHCVQHMYPKTPIPNGVIFASIWVVNIKSLLYGTEQYTVKKNACCTVYICTCPS